MDIIDTGEYEFDEVAELARKAKNRLYTSMTVIEFLFTQDEYDSDELRFCNAIKKAWELFTDKQKKVLFMRLVQEMSFVSISKTMDCTPKNISNIFYRACYKIQKSFK